MKNSTPIDRFTKSPNVRYGLRFWNGPGSAVHRIRDARGISAHDLETESITTKLGMSGYR